MSKSLSIIQSYYEEPDLLKHNLSIINQLKPIWHYFDVYCCCDGSTVDPLAKFSDLFPPNYYAFQLENRFGFNSHTIRNFLVQQSSTKWILMLDQDTFFTKRGLQQIIERVVSDEYDPNTFYMFKHYKSSSYSLEKDEFKFTKPEYRSREQCGVWKFNRMDTNYTIRYLEDMHPNCFLMTKECFQSTGGYREELQTVRDGDGIFFKSIDHSKFKFKRIKDPIVYTNMIKSPNKLSMWDKIQQQSINWVATNLNSPKGHRFVRILKSRPIKT